MKKIALTDLAKVIRSKNAGPFELTLDIIFSNSHIYKRVKNQALIQKDEIAKLYRLEPAQIGNFIFFDAANAVKITMPRAIASGAVGDSDIYGAQQHAPLLSLKFPSELVS